ncbi:Uncharacterized protein QTN25_009770 [Entamoeba marina]
MSIEANGKPNNVLMIKMIIVEFPELRKIFKGKLEDLFETTTLEELFVIAEPMFNDYIFNTDIPTEEKIHVLRLMTKDKLSENNLPHQTFLTDEFRQKLQKLRSFAVDLLDFIKSQVKNTNDVTDEIEMLNCVIQARTMVDKSQTIPIQDILDPLSCPPEVQQKKNLIAQKKKDFLNILQGASSDQLLSITQHLEQHGVTDELEFTCDIDCLSLETLQYVISFLNSHNMPST